MNIDTIINGLKDSIAAKTMYLATVENPSVKLYTDQKMQKLHASLLKLSIEENEALLKDIQKCTNPV